MADAFVADIASGLVQKLVSLATEEVIQAWKVDEDLEALRERLESINALLSDALAKKPSMSTVNDWFNKLDDVARVAAVFLDELSYEVTRQNVANHHKLRKFVIPSKNRLLYRFKVAHKIKSIHTSFDKIFERACDLGIQPVAHLSLIVQSSEIRDTPPYEDKSHTVGRDNDISHLVQKLSENYQDKLPVIGVVGMGGQGKTTLVRMVYNRDDVTNMFPRRMWVTVSDHFDYMKILNQIVESLTSTSSVLKNTEGVINAIRKKLERETFLLVLDDVWNDQPEEWDKLRNSLLGVGGARGSKILVTTRNQQVMDAMLGSVSYQLEKLPQEHSWALFKQRAFSHGLVETEAFAALGRNMVDMCGGLPLAIKTLGGLLNSKKSEKEWSLILNSEIWKSKGVLSSLRLSYDYLPNPSLKRCFAYCSIIPKDSYICKDELVQIWMALGFLVPPKDSNILMEEVGNEYFNILLWRSLLQDVKRNKLGNIIGCKMHDLVHDLAIDLSQHHSVTVQTGHELNHISKAKYVRIDESVSDIKPTILKRNLERVQVLYAGARILSGVLPYLQNLNVLVLNNDRVTTELPRSLRTMKCLKYLDISGLRSKLPGYITDLYNLQTLRVWDLDELPKKFCNLINLRHLFIKELYPETRCLLTGIERLTGLQTLPHFVASKDRNCLIGQLEGMKNLSGKLELYGLGDIGNMEESCKASLGTKSNIERLKLVWSRDDEETGETEYNDGDCHGLTRLSPGVAVETLSVVNCPDLTSINVSGGLKDLTIMRCPSLSDWGFVHSVSSTLETLSFGPLSEELDEFPWLFSCSFSKLTSLHLRGWEKLKSILPAAQIDARLSSTFPALTYLEIFNFRGVEALPDSLAKLPSLEKLSISGCENLRSLPMFEESDSLAALTISECPILEENCKKDSGSEWFKIQHISRVLFKPVPWYPSDDDMLSLIEEIERQELVVWE